MAHKPQPAKPTQRQHRTPEERELAKKTTEVAELETELAQRELDLATLQSALRAFETRYLRVVGVRFATLDQLEAQIAEALARRHAQDQELQRGAASARATAADTAGIFSVVQDAEQDEKFSPDDHLKKLYREVARRIHPDLTTDDDERARRNLLMVEVNRAYAAGDEAKLHAILDDWQSRPESVEGEGIGAELLRIIRKIDQVERRLAEIAAAIAELERLDLYKLKQKADAARFGGQADLLAQMAEQVERQVDRARMRLAELSMPGSIA